MSRTLLIIIVRLLISFPLKTGKSKEYIIQRGLCDWIIHLSTIKLCFVQLAKTRLWSKEWLTIWVAALAASILLNKDAMERTFGWMCQISWRDRRSRKRASGMTDWTLCRTSLTYSISQRALIMYPLPNLKRFWTHKTPPIEKTRESQTYLFFRCWAEPRQRSVPLTMIARRVLNLDTQSNLILIF
jgi:hypothetical protein